MEKKDNGRYLKGFLSGILCVAVLVFLIGSLDYFLRPHSIVKQLLNRDYTETYLKIKEIEENIEDYYLNETDQENIEDMMYKGLVAGLDDPYSVYYTKEEYQKLMESNDGTYVGIGAVFSQNMETGAISVTKVYKDSPSYAAGLQVGDELYEVEGESVAGTELSSVVANIKGKEEGSQVELTVIRNGENVTLNITLQQIEIPTVSCELLEDNIGYIKIEEFDKVTYNQFMLYLEQLTAEGMEGLIIDLRDNPGGLLGTVNEILDQILPEGLIVYTEDKYGNRNEYYSDEEHKLQIPMVVLINGNSASASEIFAGAMKDYNYAKLVGTTTYGKGVVQKIIELEDGTAMKLTISKYYTPNGNNIHGTGIEPDVEVELDENLKGQSDIQKDEDNQLKKAVEVLKTEMQ